MYTGRNYFSCNRIFFPLAIFSGASLDYAFALITGMDGTFAVAVTVASLYGYIIRKPIAVLLLCFPVTYIIPVGLTAFIVSKLPAPEQ